MKLPSTKIELALALNRFGYIFSYFEIKMRVTDPYGPQNGLIDFTCIPAFYIDPHYQLFKEFTYSRSRMIARLFKILSFDGTKTPANSGILTFKPFASFSKLLTRKLIFAEQRKVVSRRLDVTADE